MTMKQKLKPAVYLFFLLLLPFIHAVAHAMQGDTGKGMNAQVASKWVGTWSTAPQLVEPGNNPPSPGLSNNTLRQIIRVSIGGDSLRMRFSNEFSNSPVTLNSVQLAVSLGNGIIDPTTDKALQFDGKPDITIAPGTAITSDPVHFHLQPLTDVAVTIYFGSTSPDVTGHPGSRTTSYLLAGNEVARADFSGAVKTDHWYVINTIDVLAPESTSAVAILGNSITDGRGSGTNKQNRWPDELARRLQGNPDTRQVGVLNAGIGGNCVLRACLGPSAVNRFERDVLNQHGVKWVIIMGGINDIGQAGGSQGSTNVAQDLIAAYGQMIDSAHARGLLVYGATLLPFGGSFYDSPDHQNAWHTVNDWIRNSGRFDGVIDLDSALHDPANPARLLPLADTGDHLHPNETGHRMMAEAVDLTLFSGETSTDINENYGNRPDMFSLAQIYPNPFNPTTAISFQLPVSGPASLKIYSALGREVAMLVSGKTEAGAHRVEWDATPYPSGVYFYRLWANGFVETKKLVLLTHVTQSVYFTLSRFHSMINHLGRDVVPT